MMFGWAVSDYECRLDDTEIGMSDWEHWPDDIEIGCERL